MSLHIWHIEDGASNWYVAETAEEAVALFFRDVEEAGEGEPNKVTQVPDDQDFTVTHVDELGPNGEPNWKETRKASAWCEEKGFVAASEW